MPLNKVAEKVILYIFTHMETPCKEIADLHLIVKEKEVKLPLFLV